MSTAARAAASSVLTVHGHNNDIVTVDLRQARLRLLGAAKGSHQRCCVVQPKFVRVSQHVACQWLAGQKATLPTSAHLLRRSIQEQAVVGRWGWVSPGIEQRLQTHEVLCVSGTCTFKYRQSSAPRARGPVMCSCLQIGPRASASRVEFQGAGACGGRKRSFPTGGAGRRRQHDGSRWP